MFVFQTKMMLEVKVTRAWTGAVCFIQSKRNCLYKRNSLHCIWRNHSNSIKNYCLCTEISEYNCSKRICYTFSLAKPKNQPSTNSESLMICNSQGIRLHFCYFDTNTALELRKGEHNVFAFSFELNFHDRFFYFPELFPKAEHTSWSIPN